MSNSPFDELKDFALSLPLYISKDKKAFVELFNGESTKIVPTNSEDFKNFLLYQQVLNNKSIGADSLNNIISLVAARAVFEGARIKTSVRLGSYRNIFYYNLGNGKYCRVKSSGFEIVKHSPIVFIESTSSLPHPMPKHDENIDIWSLEKYFNIKHDDDFILLVTYIISCFVPDIAHPILILQGSQGSAKTTAARLIKCLVDPSRINVSSLPRSNDDIVLQLSNEYLTVYDNLSAVKSDVANLFCQVATGGNFVKRKLYTDSEVTVHSFKRCLILNGIDSLTVQPDLLDRSIVITLQKISSSRRLTEKELLQNFKEDLPFILYSIFDTLSMAKSLHRTLKIEHLPRMADAVQWQCCIAEALGIDYREFLKICNDNQRLVNQEVVTTHPVANALLQFMEGKKKWQGSISDLWNELNVLMCDTSDLQCAKSPSSLSRQLNVLKLSMEKVGIYFDIRNTGRFKEITVRKK